MPQGAIPFPFGDCRICNDKATGVHYGVNTCEGCKGFFKRSIPKAGKYKCFFGGMCQVNPQNRNRCKACRFQRCVQAGMSMDAVKMGRIPKVDKERALEAAARGAESTVHGLPASAAHEFETNPLLSSPDYRPSYTELTKEQSNDMTRNGASYNENDILENGMSHLSQGMDLDGRARRSSGDLNGIDEGKQRQEATYLQRFAAAHDEHLPTPPQGHLLSPPIPPAQEAPAAHMILNRNSSAQHPVPSSTHASLPTSPMPPLTLNRSPRHFGVSGSPSLQDAPPFPQHHYEGVSSWDLPGHNMSELLSGHASGSDSGISAEGSDTAQSPSDYGPIRTPVPGPIDFVAGNNSMCASKRGDGKAAFFDRRLSDSCLPVSSQMGVIHSTRDPDMTFSNPDVRITSRPDNGYTPGLNMNASIRSPALDGSSGPATPQAPRTPGPFSPVVIKELMHQVFMSRSPAVSPASLLQEIIQTAPHDEARKRILDTWGGGGEAGQLGVPGRVRHSSTPGTTSDGLSPPKRLRTESVDHYVDTLFRSQQLSAEVRVKEESTDNDRLYGGSGLDWQPDLAPLREYDDVLSRGIKTEPGLVGDVFGRPDAEGCEEPSESEAGTKQQRREEPLVDGDPEESANDGLELKGDNADSLSMIKSTLKKLEEAEEHNCERVRVRIGLFHQILDGSLKISELNKIKQATYKQVKSMWKTLFAGIPASNQMVISMCRDVPGFTNLDPKEQGMLMEAAYFDIWMLQHSVFFHKNDSYLVLTECDNVMYSRFWMSHFLPMSLINKMLAFAGELNALKLSRVQLYILCALQLTDPERKDISQVEEIRLLYNHYIDVLAYSVQQSHPNTYTRVLISIFKLLPKLYDIKMQQAQVIGKFRPNVPPEQCESMVVPGSIEECLHEEQLEKKEKEAARRKSESRDTPVANEQATMEAACHAKEDGGETCDTDMKSSEKPPLSTAEPS